MSNTRALKRNGVSLTMSTGPRYSGGRITHLTIDRGRVFIRATLDREDLDWLICELVRRRTVCFPNHPLPNFNQ